MPSSIREASPSPGVDRVIPGHIKLYQLNTKILAMVQGLISESGTVIEGCASINEAVAKKELAIVAEIIKDNNAVMGDFAKLQETIFSSVESYLTLVGAGTLEEDIANELVAHFSSCQRQLARIADRATAIMARTLPLFGA